MPRLIACLEQTFPGGKYVFIGRDTAAFVNFFEAFYHSLGQNDRVGSIGISSGSLPGMTQEIALGFLTDAGMPRDAKNFKHPFVLIDTISRGGGRQGRHLLNAAYEHFQLSNVNLANLSRYLNFVGLRGSTTSITNNELCGGFSILDSASYREFQSGPEPYTEKHILGFDDGRTPKTSFLGLNEASYVHWVGGWHGAYGEVRETIAGIRAERGAVYSEAVRAAVMNYQIHLIMAARDKAFLPRVQEQALALGYRFPLERPSFIPDPLGHLYTTVRSAGNLPELMLAWDSYSTYSMGRADPESVANVFVARARSILEVIRDPGDVAAYPQFLLKYIAPVHQKEFLAATLPSFLALNPTVESLNILLDGFKGDEHLNISIMKHMAKRIKAEGGDSQGILSTLHLPSSSEYSSRSYRVAEKELKKASLKKEDSKFTLKKIFQKLNKVMQ